MFDATRLRAIEERESEKRRDKRYRVLVVDDEPGNLQAIEAILADDFDVVVALGAEEALTWLHQDDQRDELAVVISDYRMPGADGVSFFAKLAQLAPRAKRILLTGYVDIDAVIDSINRAQIWRFVVKPYDRDDLRLTVMRAVESWEMQEQIARHVRNLEREVAERTYQLEQRNQELEKALEEVHRASRTDSLTGLRNRRYLEDTIEADLALVERKRGDDESDLLFFMIDLDHFKPINDAHGHGAGDKVLIEVARRLQDCARATDVVMRWGGEEFLLLARFIDASEAPHIAQRICDGIAGSPFEVGSGQEGSVRLTASVGFASVVQSFDQGIQGWGNVINSADQAMYRAKRDGGNRWCGS